MYGYIHIARTRLYPCVLSGVGGGGSGGTCFWQGRGKAYGPTPGEPLAGNEEGGRKGGIDLGALFSWGWYIAVFDAKFAAIQSSTVRDTASRWKRYCKEPGVLLANFDASNGLHAEYSCLFTLCPASCAITHAFDPVSILHSRDDAILVVFAAWILSYPRLLRCLSNVVIATASPTMVPSSAAHPIPKS